MPRFGIFAALIVGLVAYGSLRADSLTLGGLPDGDIDTISIQLDPPNGAVSGVPGSQVGWGFTVNWTSTNGDWISFTGSSLGSLSEPETNPALLDAYVDFIGAQGGPLDFGLSPGSWSQAFDGSSQGVGIYQMTIDPSIAVLGAQDTGQITFSFQVYNGDPLSSAQIGDGSYSYYGASTEFSAAVSGGLGTPEPATFGLLLVGAGMLAATGRRRS